MPGRNRAWADTIFCFKSVTDEGEDVSDLLVDAPTVDTLTAVRIVVDLSVRAGAATIVDGTNCVSVGIGVTSTEAFANAPPVIPSPAVSDQYPPRGWLYVATSGVTVNTIQSTSPFIQNAEFHADLRAMRKVDKGVLFIAITNTAILGTATVDVVGRVRVLCLT